LTTVIYIEKFITPLPPVTPWNAVGGCGSGAGGASGDLQMKWIGNGVEGALLDAEINVSRSVLADSSLVNGTQYDGRLRLQTTSVLLNAYYHPPKIMDIKLTVPLVFKEGNNNSSNTGPLSDMSVDLTRKWGVVGNILTGLTLVLPTGNGSMTDGPSQPLSSDNQLGGGVFGASLRGSYTFDHDWGIVSVGGSYTAGLFAMITSEYNVQQNPPFAMSSDKQVFQVSRSGLGSINDAGIVSPDFIGVFTDIGIKTEALTNGFSFNFGFPMEKGRSELRTVDVNNVSSTDFSTKEAAQAYADTSKLLRPGDSTYTFVVANTAANGHWPLLRKYSAEKAVPPSLMIQYSVEKHDMALPMLLVAMIKLENPTLNFTRVLQPVWGKLVFAGFAAGLGFKFPIY
jgi:hypothetical protein